jgi:hypothetical protein
MWAEVSAIPRDNFKPHNPATFAHAFPCKSRGTSKVPTQNEQTLAKAEELPKSQHRVWMMRRQFEQIDVADIRQCADHQWQSPKVRNFQISI